MVVPFVRVKNKVHGGVASLPKSALPNLPDWEPVDGPKPSRPKSRIQSQPTNAAPAASTETE